MLNYFSKIFFSVIFILICLNGSNSFAQLTTKNLVVSSCSDSGFHCTEFNHFVDNKKLINQRDSLSSILRIKNQSKPKFHSNRLIISSIGLLALNVAAYQPFKKTWWDAERTNFHFYQGWRRTKGYLDFGWYDSYCWHIDKMGHYYSSRILSEQLTYLSRWIGFSDNSSKWIGPIISSLLMLEIEIYDGFFKEWGFSLADFTANELGAFSPMVENKISFMNDFIFKLSYHTSNQPKNESTFVKDYPGMTFWVSWNISTLLPKKFKNCYPEWLNLALGYSVTKYAHGDVELYLAPDINWEKVAIGNSDTAKFIKRVLNYFHFPSVTWQLKPQSRFYLFYY